MNKNKNRDLCLTCEHYWEEYPALWQDGIPHCEKVDEKYGLWDMDLYVAYPCVECPFNCYSHSSEPAVGPDEISARQAYYNSKNSHRH